MNYTPRQIVDYIFENNLEGDFLSAVQLHKGDFSIGEIADKKFKLKDEKCFFMSKMYSINTEVMDEDIITAVHNDLYISAFVSRKGTSFNVHFLVHQYPNSMKERFEDNITVEVVRYMITSTVLALRLDSIEKVKSYIG